MIYIVNADGTTRRRVINGGYQQLVDILDDIPTHIALPETRDLPGGPACAWVGDDYIGRETNGNTTRNIRGTILLWALGAPRQPYAGPIAFTGIHENAIDGRIPVGTPPVALSAIEQVYADINAALERAAHHDLPDAVITEIRTNAFVAAEMEYESMSMWTHDR